MRTSNLFRLNLFFVLLTVVLLQFAAPRAQAQFRDESHSITNTIPAASTNAAPVPTGARIDVSRVTEFSVQVVAKLTGAGTTAIPIAFERSVDGSNWATGFTLLLTPAGTTLVNTLTNVTTGAVPYWRIASVGNPNANAITNLAVTTGLKRNVN